MPRSRVNQQLCSLIRTGKHKAAFWVSIAFLLLYVAISWVNHYVVYTETLDLGLYTNALWDYGHFKLHYGECLDHYRENILSSHFDLYLMLFAPLGYIFGSYTLLIVQTAAILVGGWGAYRLALSLGLNKATSVGVLVYYFSFFGIYSALAFDYHSNVVAAQAVPWLVLFAKEKRWIPASLVLLFALIGKESMAIWIVGICLSLLLLWRKERSYYIPLIGMSLFSMLYFYIVLEYAMPAFSHRDKYIFQQYALLGESVGDVVFNLLTHPWDYAKYFVIEHHTGKVSGAKMEFYIFFALSGGVLLLTRPALLLMLAPLLVQKMPIMRTAVWGINDQYSIEFGPVLAIGLIYTLLYFKNDRLKTAVAILAAGFAAFTTFQSFHNSMKGPHNVKGQFYAAQHWVPKHDVKRVKEVLNMIPKDGAVVGSSRLIAQLAYRDRAYRLPQTKEANYFVHCWDFSAYPLNPTPMRELVDELKASGEWESLIDDGYMVLLRRYEFKDAIPVSNP